MTIDQGELGIDLSKELEAHAVEKARLIVEDALQKLFGRNTDTEAKWYKGRLSTDPQKVDPSIISDDFFSKCGKFSEELYDNLTAMRVESELSCSARPDWEAHIYLTMNMDGVEVLIDPSIGQFLEGYNHVFVGTRKQLRDIVMNKTSRETTPEKPYRIRRVYGLNTPPEAFDRVWGLKSLPIPRRSQ